MSYSRTITRSAAVPRAVWLALLFTFASCGFAWDYGNGRHGSFVLTTNVTIGQLYQAVRLTNDPAQYDPTNTNAIPNFQNLIITNGATLTANAWNGSSGGLIDFKVEATLYVAGSSGISVSGAGYRGGTQAFPGSYNVGVQGESYAGTPVASGSANYGGGGSVIVWSISNGHPNYSGTGAGGGYGANGTSSYNNFCVCGANGGGTYGNASIDTVYLGSGGGGDVIYPSGGNGGGAILITGGNIRLDGRVQADGTTTGGGGGSGGSIKLMVAASSLGTNQVTANGGGGNAPGGVGRIAVYYAEAFSGSTTPATYTLLDTNSDNVTVITNQPATQTNFLGANVVFNVGVYGLPTWTFQWDFNGAPIPGATNQVLSLTNIALTNTRNYSVTISNAVMALVSSNAFLKVLDTAIPLGDGIPNWWKLQYGFSVSDPTLATNHPAGDRLTYLQKYLYGLNPLTTDTDGDGLSDYDELFVYHSNPLATSTSGDGIPDGWKVQYGLNPLVSSASSEAGFDGVTYMQVYQYNLAHTNQLDPNRPFAVGTGFSSYEIINGGQHTNRFYYDREDRLVGMESSRGISIAYMYDGNGNLLRQTVLSRASETNGLPVLWSFLNGLTNNPSPFADPDGDGWSNYQEWLAGTDPNNPSSQPNLVSLPGANVAALSVPFAPSNFVAAAGHHRD